MHTHNHNRLGLGEFHAGRCGWVTGGMQLPRRQCICVRAGGRVQRVQRVKGFVHVC